MFKISSESTSQNSYNSAIFTNTELNFSVVVAESRFKHLLQALLIL